MFILYQRIFCLRGFSANFRTEYHVVVNIYSKRLHTEALDGYYYKGRTCFSSPIPQDCVALPLYNGHRSHVNTRSRALSVHIHLVEIRNRDNVIHAVIAGREFVHGQAK